MLNTLRTTTHFTKKKKKNHYTLQRTHYKEQITTNYKYIKKQKHTHTHITNN